MISKKCSQSYIKCGEIYKQELPYELNKSQEPIVIGKVEVDTKYIRLANVNIKYSEFIGFELLGINPIINIIYRLVRKNKCSQDEILQEWEFEFESANTLEIANLNTIQPTVLNYSDDINDLCKTIYTYEMQIVQIKTNSVKSYELKNQSIVANVMNQFDECSFNIPPYIQNAKVYNPVLPLSLNEYDEPILLTELNITSLCNCDVGVLINFSGFVSSILRNENFNELTFRLTKENNHKIQILREWPFKRAFVSDTNISEPIVYDYCEYLRCSCDKEYIYKFEIIKADLSKNSYYEITQKSMSAQIYYKENDCN